MAESTFEGVLQGARGGGAFIELPANVIAELGGTRVRVRGRLNNVEFTSSTMPTGGGRACLGVHKATREAAGVAFGERAKVQLSRDDSPRDVQVPDELRTALEADRSLRAVFDSLSFSHRREYAEWIASAKKPETRERRVAETLRRLRSK
jgi:Bacteriocin-protection, YdeI or OmpD-Associated/Domain of unknown function (DUF1905)